MVVADVNDTNLINPNELLYFLCPPINNHLEGVITIKFKTGGNIQFPFQLVFYSSEKNSPAFVGLGFPKGYSITENLSVRIFDKCLKIFLKLKREKEIGITFEDKLNKSAGFNGLSVEEYVGLILGSAGEVN